MPKRAAITAVAACQNWSTAPGTGTAIMVMAYPVIVIGQYRRVRSRLGMGSAVCARHVDGRVVLHSGGRQEGARAESYACRGLGSVSGVGHHSVVSLFERPEFGPGRTWNW